MPVRPFVIGGLLLLLLGLLGEFMIFPGMLALDGGEFVDQIRKENVESGDEIVRIEKYEDYDVGDTVRIVDTIARIQVCDHNTGQTCIWLDSIPTGEQEIYFTFDGNLLSDYDRGDTVVITFEVAQLGSGETPVGYDTDADALATDAIAPRYSTQLELAFGGLAVMGLLLLAFSGFSAWRGGDEEEEADWGATVPTAAPVAAPAVAPVMAGAAPVTAPIAVAPPTTQPAVHPTRTEMQLIQCPACQAQLQINDSTRPLSITCPGCQAGMVVR